MQRIIISISELNKPNWALIYIFIKDYYNNSLSQATFNELKNKTTALRITDQALHKDVYSAYGSNLTYQTLPYSNQTTFCIIYYKQDNTRDFSNIVPFYFLHREFVNKITLGISLAQFLIDDITDFTFPCRTFLECFRDTKPNNGENTVYFIDEKSKNKTTNKIDHYRTARATFKNISEDNISRYILPLTLINESSFSSLFKNKRDNHGEYLLEAINKQNATLKIKPPPIKEGETAKQLFRSIFEEWFIKAYFISLDKKLDKKIDDECFAGLFRVLKSYCDSIKELVENIIFHTETKEGVMYVVFHKQENLTSEQQKGIVNFDSYNASDRFVEIGIMDFNKKGILEKYKETEDVETKDVETKDTELLDFFDVKRIHTKGFDRLYFKYAAHMGIKTFANAIKNHNGSFYVETNNNGTKEAIEYFSGKLPEAGRILEHFYDGTHYEIIFPVKNDDKSYEIKKSYATYYQKLPIMDKAITYLKNELLASLIESYSSIMVGDITEISSKDNQKKYIAKIGNLVIERAGEQEAIAIDMENKIIGNINLLLKILSYIQLNSTTYKYIIFANLLDENLEEICNIIDKMLIKPFEDEESKPEIWSNNSALILITKNLRYQIIFGETKGMLGYINHKMSLYYPNENFFAGYFDESDIDGRSRADEFILPYESLIENNSETVFQQYVSNCLDNEIEMQNIGCKVGHNYTRIGSKIIVKNYYEADFLFQNSFFVTRFAFLVSRKIFKELKEGDNEKTIVLIGYHEYSEHFVKKIKQFIAQYDSRYKFYKDILIAKDDNNEVRFEREKEEDLKNDKSKDDYKYITIVPIGSTLTTNDKIISTLSKTIGSQLQEDALYNHCTILVRDRLDDKYYTEHKITVDEGKQKWKCKIIKDNAINTDLTYAKQVTYLIAKEGIWKQLINRYISFPVNYWKEHPVNQTQNASLNSQNLFGYPRVVIPKKYMQDKDDYLKLTEERLEELKYHILLGHIKRNNSCHRYYIDTNDYMIKTGKSKFYDWIKEVKNSKEELDNKNDRLFFDQNVLNIIITPLNNIDSYFVDEVNKKIFGDAALVLYIDIDNWRSNIKGEYSFLKDINNTQYHFVDHALLTSLTYKKAKSYIMSIMDNSNEKTFRSIITLSNKLSYDINKEIAINENVTIFSFVNLFIPPTRDHERSCSLCELNDHYNEVKKSSILENCHNSIEKRNENIAATRFDKYKDKRNLIKLSDKKRYFIRMKLTNRILFMISNIFHDFEDKNDIDALDEEILRSLKILFYECKDNMDERISFLKVISTPPLAYYIKIRYHAHEILLEGLKNVLNCKKPNYGKLCELKIILKQLSALGSNALVRRDVIINAWNLYINFVYQIPDELKKTSEEISDKEQELEEIKDMLTGRDQEADLKMEIKELKIIEERLKNENKYRDFNRDFQFIIKNTIFIDEAKSMWLGELLRRGEEIEGKDIKNEEDVEDIDEFKISKTQLENNTMLEAFSNERDDVRAEYRVFLEWLFYDNTTIIRKTLENFNNEINKPNDLNDLFHKDKGNLLNNDDVQKAKKLFRKEVESQYYYASFKRYLENPDGIDFIEKLVYVLCAQLKLKDLNVVGDFKMENFESNIKFLIRIFAKIMDADMVMFAMKEKTAKNNGDIHLISSVNLEQDVEEDDDMNNFDFRYYAYKELESHISQDSSPMIIRYDLGDCYENDKLKYSHVNYFHIHNTLKKEEKNKDKNRDKKKDEVVIAAIYFFYKNKEERFNDKIDYKIKSQEYSRLLLLLKNDLVKYIEHILREKIYDLWIEKEEFKKLDKDFISRYIKNYHDPYKDFDKVSKKLFDKYLHRNPDLYSVFADVQVGRIHHSLLVKKPIAFRGRLSYMKEKVSMKYILCVRRRLLNACFKKENIQFRFSDFEGKRMYYSKEILFLLFQLVNNIINHTRAKREAKISFSVEKESIVVKNTRSNISHDQIRNIEQYLSDTDNIPRKSISLYCINHHIRKILGNGGLTKTGLSLSIDGEDTFIVRIPIIEYKGA